MTEGKVAICILRRAVRTGGAQHSITSLGPAANRWQVAHKIEASQICERLGKHKHAQAWHSSDCPSRAQGLCGASALPGTRRLLGARVVQTPHYHLPSGSRDRLGPGYNGKQNRSSARRGAGETGPAEATATTAEAQAERRADFAISFGEREETRLSPRDFLHKSYHTQFPRRGAR